ncbi:MAG: ShlB/FhaC/HecB family hemolysin secretion/activation protein [Pseudomonadota bacterium]
MKRAQRIRFASISLASASFCVLVPAAIAQERDDARQVPKIAFAPTLQIGRGFDPGTPQNASDKEQIGAVLIRGNEGVADERYQEVVEQFFGEPLTDEVLERLSDELAQLAREEGYSYVRTDIDRNANGMGMVEISIDEGRVDAIEIEGYKNAQAERILSRLIGGPVRKQDLESALLLVSDIPAVRLRDAKLQRKGGRGVLVVKLSKRDNLYRVSGDNYGSESFGPYRMRGTAQLRDVLTSSDVASLSIRINPVDPDELLYLSGSYSTQLTSSGASWGVDGSIGNTSPGGQIGNTEVEGDSLRLGTSITVPLLRGKNASLWFESRAEYISIEQDDLDQMLRDDTVVTLAAGLRTQFAVAGGQVRLGVSHLRGIDILGATRFGDPLASRRDGDGVFTKLDFWGDARFPLFDRVSMLLAAGGQLADRPLLASEEIALGGAYRTRGYGFSEVLGDEGAYGLAELRYSVPSKGIPFDFLQFYAFIDGGYVSDIDSTGSEGSLFSAGPGVRARIGKFDFEVESGFPLGGSGERDTGNEPEINVRAGINF